VIYDIQKGGLLMWPILACSIISIGLFAERLFYLHRATIHVGEFLKGLSNLIQRRNFICTMIFQWPHTYDWPGCSKVNRKWWFQDMGRGLAKWLKVRHHIHADDTHLFYPEIYRKTYLSHVTFLHLRTSVQVLKPDKITKIMARSPDKSTDGDINVFIGTQKIDITRMSRIWPPNQ